MSGAEDRPDVLVTLIIRVDEDVSVGDLSDGLASLRGVRTDAAGFSGGSAAEIPEFDVIAVSWAVKKVLDYLWTQLGSRFTVRRKGSDREVTIHGAADVDVVATELLHASDDEPSSDDAGMPAGERVRDPERDSPEDESRK